MVYLSDFLDFFFHLSKLTIFLIFSSIFCIFSLAVSSLFLNYTATDAFPYPVFH